MSSLSAIIMHVEATLVPRRRRRRSFKVDSIGLPYFVMPMPIFQPVRDARSWGALFNTPIKTTLFIIQNLFTKAVNRFSIE
jgi:hypothetical protein